MSSCSKTLVSGDSQNAGLVDIVTVSEGAVLYQGDQLPLLLYFDPEFASPNEVSVELSDSEGGYVDGADLEYSDDLKAFELASLSEGSYTLGIVIKEEDGTIIGEKNVVFFYTDKEFAIEQISSYPPSIEPDSEILFQGDFKYPEGSDPFVRWTFDGELITQGLLSMTGDVLQWKVPEKPGVYTLTAELYPFAPAGSSGYDFRAPYTMKGSIFTVRRLEPSLSELSPENMYPYLYHFRGNFRSHGYEDSPEYSIEGSPNLSVENGIFGYAFDESKGIVYENNLLKTEDLSDFRYIIQLKGVFDEVEDEASFFSIGDLFQLNVVPGGFALAAGDYTYSFEKESGYIFLGLRIAENDGLFSLEWYDEGELRQSSVLATETVEQIAALDAESRLGFGFSGVLDEFGIISTAGDDSGFNQFVQAMQIKHGTDLILAEGFDAGLWSSDSRLSFSGETAIGGSALRLSEGSSLSGTGFEVPTNGMEIIFGADEDTFSVISVTYDDGSTLSIDLEYEDGYYSARIPSLQTETGEETAESIYQEPVLVDFKLDGPGKVKSLLLINVGNDSVGDGGTKPASG